MSTEFSAEQLAAARAELTPESYAGKPILFAGTPEVAARALRGLLDAGVQVSAVLTRPDAPVGRKRRLTPSPVAQTAVEHGIKVITADVVDADVTAQLQSTNAVLGVVVAYGALLPQYALDALPGGWVNLHYSKLPAYRGAAPVQHAILNSETTTAATVFQLERGMDTGPIHGYVSAPIAEGVTASVMLDTLTDLGTSLLNVLLPDLLAGRSTAQPQQGQPSMAPKLGREDAYIDPRQPAQQLVSRINATIPEPGAWSFRGTDRVKLGAARLYRPDSGSQLTHQPPGSIVLMDSDRSGTGSVVVLVAADAQGVVLSQVQPAGKQMMNAMDWYRGLQGQQVYLGGEHE